MSKFNLTLSKTTVPHQLDLKLCTLKGIIRVRETSNSPYKKEKKLIFILNFKTHKKENILHRHNKLQLTL